MARVVDRKLQVSQHQLETLTIDVDGDEVVFGVGVILLGARSAFGNVGASWSVSAGTLREQGAACLHEHLRVWWLERLTEEERAAVLQGQR